MKKVLLTLAAVAMAGSAYAQGTITFFNNNILDGSGASYRAGVFRPDGSGAGAGFTVGLFLAADAGNPTATPLATTTFRTANNFEVFATSVEATVPGVAPGATAQLVVRAWETAGSFGTGTYGQSAIFTSKPLGGTNPNPPPPSFFTPDMGGMQSFTMVPEPGSLALGALGLGALLLRRRK